MAPTISEAPVDRQDVQPCVRNGPEPYVDDLLAALQTYNDEVGSADGEGRLDLTGTFGNGDVLDLLKFLRLGLVHSKTR